MRPRQNAPVDGSLLHPVRNKQLRFFLRSLGLNDTHWMTD